MTLPLYNLAPGASPPRSRLARFCAPLCARARKARVGSTRSASRRSTRRDGGWLTRCFLTGTTPGQVTTSAPKAWRGGTKLDRFLLLRVPHGQSTLAGR
jgi:hypothetical protein